MISDRTEKAWRDFLTFADWSSVSSGDLSCFAKVIASAHLDDATSLLSAGLFERDLNQEQIKSPLFQAALEATDWMTETLLSYDDLRIDGATQ